MNRRWPEPNWTLLNRLNAEQPRRPTKGNLRPWDAGDRERAERGDPGIWSSGIAEVYQEAYNAHVLLDMLGVSGRDLDARVSSLVLSHIGLNERLSRIAGWHDRETGPAGMVGDYCTECGERWPCGSRVMADGTWTDEAIPGGAS